MNETAGLTHAWTHIPFADREVALRNWQAILRSGLAPDQIARLEEGLSILLAGLADPGMALNNLERLIAQATRDANASAIDILARHLDQPQALAVLLQLFSTSQYFSNIIIDDPTLFKFLWEQGHAAIDPKQLRETILREARETGYDARKVLESIRRYRRRELLRIGYRDIILGEPLDRITGSISDLADCLVEVSIAVAYHRQVAKWGEPRSLNGQLSRLVVLALGKLGGQELNYSSDIDLMLVYDRDGHTDGKRSIENSEFFTHVIRDMIQLLAQHTDQGHAYRVDLRLRPHGREAPLCLSLANTIAYYDRHGRTWERQTLVKVRPIAGWIKLGNQFLRAIEPFIYRKYLTSEEINEMKAIKRRIEAKTRDAGQDTTDLKTGHGGIRDIEFVIQFLQLLNGGRRPQVRDRNTLNALRRLHDAGCIHADEYTALDTAYRFLRKVEHRLQFMFDLQTHRIPTAQRELDKLAIRLGYRIGETIPPGAAFLADLRSLTDSNRAILHRLMLDLFAEETGRAEPESDLILDPEPETERISAVLGRFGFRDIPAAYKNLMLLAEEEIPFLSSIRCRHFLAGIAPKLLHLVAETPDPDWTLINLEKVSRSLGAKGVLWESCSRNPPLLHLYVQLCSRSQFLSEILIKNPGMIDELLDSLVLNNPPTLEELKAQLKLLVKGARDLDPILHSFRDTRLLEIGILDILGKQQIRETTEALSDLAEAIIGQIIELEWKELVARYGIPMLEGNVKQPSRYSLLAMGKLGGRELGYHSDLDLVLVYEGDGRTAHRRRSPAKGTTTNHHFYSELAQRLAATAGRMGPLGRLYQVDFRLRPTGSSGSLVIPMDKFEAYYRSKRGAMLWERQALTRARVLVGSPSLSTRLSQTIHGLLRETPWVGKMVEEIAAMRDRLEASRAASDIKRGPGGVVDVEFAVQLMQLRYGASHPAILRPNIWDALDAIEDAGLWSAERTRIFREGYTFLRRVESRLRIVYDVSRNDLPEEEDELRKLAVRLGYEGRDAPNRLLEDARQYTQEIRVEYYACLAEEQERS